MCLLRLIWWNFKDKSIFANWFCIYLIRSAGLYLIKSLLTKDKRQHKRIVLSILLVLYSSGEFHSKYRLISYRLHVTSSMICYQFWENKKWISCLSSVQLNLCKKKIAINQDQPQEITSKSTYNCMCAVIQSGAMKIEWILWKICLPSFWKPQFTSSVLLEISVLFNISKVPIYCKGSDLMFKKIIVIKINFIFDLVSFLLYKDMRHQNRE